MRRDRGAGRPLRICFVIFSRRGGGAERASSELAGLLAEMGADISIVTKFSSAQDYPISNKVRLYLVKPVEVWWLFRRWYWIRSLNYAWNHVISPSIHTWKSMKMVWEIKPDIIVPFLAWGERVGFRAAKLGRMKVIYTIRNNPALTPKRRMDRFKRNVRCFFSDAVYVQDAEQIGYFPAFMRKKIFVLPNVVRQEFFGISRPSRGEIRHFMTAGRLTPQKNQEMLIRAFAGLVGRFPDKDLTLRIFGVGILQDELAALIDGLDMREHIFLEGRSLNISEEYARADAFVLSSDFEGQPNALMEAMAAGLVCVSTDCPTGPSGLIQDGTDGLLVPCGDEERMLEALTRLVEDPAAAEEMARNARERMEALCDRERIGRVFLDRCYEIMER